MKLLTFLTLASVLFGGAAVASESPIEGIDKDTYNQNTRILMQNRPSYSVDRDFYYDYKYSDDYMMYEETEYEYKEYEYEEYKYMMEEDTEVEMMSDDSEDVEINGAF